jgi:hypothetical protein
LCPAPAKQTDEFLAAFLPLTQTLAGTTPAARPE